MKNTLASSALVALLTAGCGTTATIRTVDGRMLVGEIRGSNADAVFIGDGSARISRSEIAEIDHPGNGAGTTGLVLVAYGILNGFIVMNEYQSNSAAALVGFSPAILGAGMAIWGFSVWGGSVSRAGAGGSRVSAVPMIVPTPQGAMYGAAMGARF